MKVKNYNFKSLEEFKKHVFMETASLIQVFSGLIQLDEIEELRNNLKVKFPNIPFIGTTTAGEIHNGEISEQGITLSLMKFESTSVEVNYFEDEDPFKLGVNTGKNMIKENTKVLILFVDGLFTNGSYILDGIASINSDTPVAGGMAGDNGFFKQTYVFTHEKIISNKGLVVAALNSEQLNVITDYQLNWQPVGKTMTVTKVEDNRLYELDGEPLANVYRKYLGDQIGDGLPHSAIEFPLIKINEEGIEICRTFVHLFDDGSLLTIGNLEQDDKVNFAFGNVQLILNNTKYQIEKGFNFEPECIYTYSCASRITFLQSEVIMELEPLEKVAPMSGFFTYGEIFHKNGKNNLLNISLTMLLLSENNQQTKLIQPVEETKSVVTENFFQGKHFLVLDALTNLTNQVISELNEQNEIIEELNQHTRDSINYASLIQSALIPEQHIFDTFFDESFVIWQPKDIVGGDIYLLEQISDDECLLMIIDCTGHGVPGAFVTMLVKAIERMVIAEIVNNKFLRSSPARILEFFNINLKKILKQEDESSISNVGFDGGILYYNKSKKIAKYSGAETPLFYFEDNKLNMIKGDRHSIGYKKSDAFYKFKETKFKIKSDMQFYITSDGYLDQNGGDKGYPLGKKRFKQLLLDSHNEYMSDQKEMLLYGLSNYQAENERNDDITVVGLKF